MCNNGYCSYSSHSGFDHIFLCIFAFIAFIMAHEERKCECESCKVKYDHQATTTKPVAAVKVDVKANGGQNKQKE